MMGGIAGRKEVEGAVLEGQPLGGGLRRLQIGEAALLRGRGNGGEHLGGEVGRRDAAGMAGEQVGDMAAATADIDGTRRLQLADDRLERLEVGTLRMDGTVDIGLGAGTERGIDEVLVNPFHRLFFLLPPFGKRSL